VTLGRNHGGSVVKEGEDLLDELNETSGAHGDSLLKLQTKEQRSMATLN